MGSINALTNGNKSAKRATLARLDPQLHNAADGKPVWMERYQNIKFIVR